MKPLAVLLCAIALSFSIFAHAPQSVWACEPTAAPDGIFKTHTTADRAQNAPLVFDGMVKDVAGPSRNIATVQVHEWLKGTGPAIVTVSGFGYGPDCLSSVEVNQHLIFYAKGNPPNNLSAVYIGIWEAVEPYNPNAVATVSAASGQNPFIPTEQNVPDTSAVQTRTTMLCLLLPVLLCLAGLGAFLMLGRILLSRTPSA